MLSISILIMEFKILKSNVGVPRNFNYPYGIDGFLFQRHGWVHLGFPSVVCHYWPTKFWNARHLSFYINCKNVVSKMEDLNMYQYISGHP